MDIQQYIESIDKIDFFEFQKLFYTNPKKFAKISNKQKEKHFFMLLRGIGKVDPILANKFQGHAHWTTVDFLHSRLCKGVVPSAIYKSDKSKSEKLEYQKHSSNVLDYVLKTTDYELKSIVSYCKRFPNEAKKLFKEASDAVNSKTLKTKSKKAV